MWIPVVVTAIDVIAAYVAGDVWSRGSWIHFAWAGVWLIGVPCAALTWIA